MKNFNEIPVFLINGNQIDITGRAIPEHAGAAWSDFLTILERYIVKMESLVINFKLDYYNTSSSMYITDMFNILTKNHRCKSTVNWYYYEADWTNYENGEIYQERNPKIKVNLIIRTD